MILFSKGRVLLANDQVNHKPNMLARDDKEDNQNFGYFESSTHNHHEIPRQDFNNNPPGDGK